jgi:c-di-GMP-binding flagellar brake protein YcgR
MVERRTHPRFSVRVPVEVHAESSDAPLHCTTSDISLGGCYIESMYPLPTGTSLDLKLQISDTLVVAGKVVTCYPQVGNGIEFVRMLPEDREQLRKFLESVEKELAEKA